MARVNLCAVLRTLEQLPNIDDRAAALCRGVDETIQFTVAHRAVPAATLAARAVCDRRKRTLRTAARCGVTVAKKALPAKTVVRIRIADGQISHHMGPGPASIKLFFPSPGAVNAMFSGDGNPIPTKGFSKIAFLKGPFTELTDILEQYLRLTPVQLDDPVKARANAKLTLHLAAYALAEIGNFDPSGRENAARMADGDIVLAVRGDDPVAVTISARGGVLSARPGPAASRRAAMVFSDLDVAGKVLRGELAAFTAIGREQLELGGYIPSLDHMNKILGIVPRYLA